MIMSRFHTHLDVVFLVFIFAISSFGVTTAQNDGSIELFDFAKHVSFGQSVYHFYNESCCTYEEAKSNCSKIGGFLAHVKTQSVWQFIRNEIVPDLIDYRFGYSYDMLWIGLHQVGENNSIWEWSDGTPLDGGKDNTNWNKDWYGEPDTYHEECVGVITKRCKYEQTAEEGCDTTNNDHIGKWADEECTNNNKFICENPYGSGFVSTLTVVVGGDPETVDCTVFGDTTYSAIWHRNGIFPSNTDERIYQQVDEYTEYRTSTITFANPLQSDEGNYICSLTNEYSATLKTFTIQLQTTPYLSEPDLPPSHKISETQNITCTASGRPIPIITWKIGDVDLERNDQIFQVFNTINENTLTSESVFSIINPISFEGNTSLSCVAEVVDEGLETVSNVSINTDFSEFDGAIYSVDGITSRQKCENINGIFIDHTRKCHLPAAEMIETEEEKCGGSELSIQIRDFTETATNYNLMVTNSDNLIAQYDSNTPWKEEKIIIGNLQPRTEYFIQLQYKPQYWSTSVELSNAFQTKGTIPDIMNINRAQITSNDECKVEFILPTNIKSSQLTTIMVNVTQISQSKENYKIYSIPYVQDMNSFEFKTENNQSTYKFTTKLVTCAGDIGNETEVFECIRVSDTNPTQSNDIVSLLGWIVAGVIIFLNIIAFSYLYYINKIYKQRNNKIGDNESRTTNLHNSNISVQSL